VDEHALALGHASEGTAHETLRARGSEHLALALASAQRGNAEVLAELRRLRLEPADASDINPTAVAWAGLPSRERSLRVLAKRPPPSTPGAPRLFDDPARHGDHRVSAHPAFGAAVGVELHASSVPKSAPPPAAEAAAAALPPDPKSRVKLLAGQGLVAARFRLGVSLAREIAKIGHDSKALAGGWSSGFLPHGVQDARVAATCGAIHAWRRASPMVPAARQEQAARAYLRGGDATGVLSVLFRASSTPHGTSLSSVPMALLGDANDAESTAPVPMAAADLAHPLDPLVASVEDMAPAQRLVEAVSLDMLGAASEKQARAVAGLQTFARQQSAQLRQTLMRSRSPAALAALFCCDGSDRVSPWLRHELEASARDLLLAARPQAQAVHFAAIASGMAGAALAAVPAVPFGHVLTPNVARYHALSARAQAREQVTDAVRSLRGHSEAAAARLVARGMLAPNRLSLFLRLHDVTGHEAIVADGMQCEFFCERLVLIGQNAGTRTLDTICRALGVWDMMLPIVRSSAAGHRFREKRDPLSRARLVLAEVQLQRARERGRAGEEDRRGEDPDEGQDYASRPLRAAADKIRAASRQMLVYFMAFHMQLHPEQIAVAAERVLGIPMADVAERLAGMRGAYVPPAQAVRGCVRAFRSGPNPLERLDEGYVPCPPSLLVLASQRHHRTQGRRRIWASTAVAVEDLPELSGLERGVRSELEATLSADKLEAADGRVPTLFGEPVHQGREAAERQAAAIDDSTRDREARSTVDALIGRDVRTTDASARWAEDARPIGLLVRREVGLEKQAAEVRAGARRAAQVASELEVPGAPEVRRVLGVLGAQVTGREAELRHESRGPLRAVEPHMTSDLPGEAAAAGRVGSYRVPTVASPETGFSPDPTPEAEKEEMAAAPGRAIPERWRRAVAAAREVHDVLEEVAPGTHEHSGPVLARDHDDLGGHRPGALRPQRMGLASTRALRRALASLGAMHRPTGELERLPSSTAN